MKYMQSKKIIIALVIAGINFSSYAIQKRTAQAVTVVITALSCATSYKKIWPTAKRDVHPLLFGVVHGAIPLGLYSYLYSFTPQGRLKKVNYTLHELKKYVLIKKSFIDDKDFFDTMHDVYLTHDLPLISAYHNVIDIVPVMNNLFELLDKVKRDVGDDAELQHQYEYTLEKVQKIFHNISDALKRIRQHPDYLSQLQIYKEFLANDKQVAVQAQIAQAQMQMASAQQSSTLLKWLKALFGR